MNLRNIILFIFEKNLLFIVLCSFPHYYCNSADVAIILKRFKCLDKYVKLIGKIFITLHKRLKICSAKLN
jgi:hypothetical protein